VILVRLWAFTAIPEKGSAGTFVHKKGGLTGPPV
jgi:hypothetical protein